MSGADFVRQGASCNSERACSLNRRSTSASLVSCFRDSLNKSGRFAAWVTGWDSGRRLPEKHSATGQDHWVVLAGHYSTFSGIGTLGLQWQDLDLILGEVSVRRSLRNDKGKVHLRPPNTNSAKWWRLLIGILRSSFCRRTTEESVPRRNLPKALGYGFFAEFTLSEANGLRKTW
jgi:hypothetical protein